MAHCSMRMHAVSELATRSHHIDRPVDCSDMQKFHSLPAKIHHPIPTSAGASWFQRNRTIVIFKSSSLRTEPSLDSREPTLAVAWPWSSTPLKKYSTQTRAPDLILVRSHPLLSAVNALFVCLSLSPPFSPRAAAERAIRSSRS